jgi:PPOX class probable FMN-dependent enzyme
MIEAPAQRFAEVVRTEEEMRALLGHPSEMVIKKAQPRLDEHCRAFIAMSPFMLLGTAEASGHCDVSPRGDGPGFVHVLDEQTLLIPDRPGNKRFDSLRNIIEHGAVGLLFMIPQIGETLRVNGRAQIIRDADLLARLEAQGKIPALAIAVDVEEAFIQCAKALKRSHLWEPESWQDPSLLTSRAKMFIDHASMTDVTVEEMEASLAESYAKRLY